MFKYYVYNENNTEKGFYVSAEEEINREILSYLIGEISLESKIKTDNHKEIGPLLNFRSPWCSNAISIFEKCGIKNVERVEQTFVTNDLNYDYDKMTHMDYKDKHVNFETEKPVTYNLIPLKEIDKYNKKLSLSLDKSDIQYYTNLFKKYKRCPTDVELYDLAQSNSEHSRHCFFTGKLIIKNLLSSTTESKTLMNYIKEPLKKNKGNSILAFCDNASAISGFKSTILSKKTFGGPSRLVRKNRISDICFTAETHNFPTSIAPFPGAATGTGGRIRDNQAIGRGGEPISSSAGYCVGNLLIPNYELPWEGAPEKVDSIATPLNILIEASNGASDYGNKFGEPIIQGFARSYGNTLNGNRIEWLKPIMFTGGLGRVSRSDLIKRLPELGMVIVKLGGPAYRIGMGGGAASSRSHSNSDMDANYNAVQRGDPEMENKMNRVIRTCIEMGIDNPIVSIHDQGAGGTANVTKELVYPNGAFIDINNIISGDESLSVLEKWVCEYQEQVSILVEPKSINLIKKISLRENCPCAIIGYVNNSRKIQVYDSKSENVVLPVDLNLEDVLGDIPQKEYILKPNQISSSALKLPKDLSILSTLDRVLRLVSVGSKRFLTNKVDRSVTGLIAQQQCVGPLHTPLSNMAITAQSYYFINGSVTAIGEQPMKGLVDTEIMARMSIAEMITNIMWTKISRFEDIKCAGNWMWPGKDPINGHHLYKAVKAVAKTMLELGIAIDGGKDSMSMRVEADTKTIDSPKSFVVSGYAPCLDITQKITPDLKLDESYLFYIDLANNKCRTGGSALAQVFEQVGNKFPDIESTTLLKSVFECVQNMIEDKLIVSGHDRSDGGLITTIIEMCIAGNRGCNVHFNSDMPVIDYLFAEELGLIIEAPNFEDLTKYVDEIPIYYIGRTNKTRKIIINYNDHKCLDTTVKEMRNIWEGTSFELEKLQCNVDCVKEEIKNIDREPVYKCSNKVGNSLVKMKNSVVPIRPKVAILREEGSNGDCEMSAAFDIAGFEVWDINMNDMSKDSGLLDEFNGIAFVGGFSYSDVFGAAKGWSATIKYNKTIKEQFERFYKREDTFSFGICNGCQLMAELEWIPKCKFVKNKSNRFESRFSTVKINKSNSIMLEGMEGLQLGIWVAHGEGQCVYDKIPDSCVAVNYIDEDGNPTEDYPLNPNGSKEGVTGICSENGRHLAMMPHPERCFLKWQVPYSQKCFNYNSSYYPWFLLFINSYNWCKQFKK